MVTTFFFLEINLATIGPRDNCQRAIWPRKAHGFDTPAVQGIPGKDNVAVDYLSHVMN